MVILILVAYGRRFVHFWAVVLEVMVHYLTNNVAALHRINDEHHAHLTSWDPSRPQYDRTVDISCACGRVFWTRPGWFDKRPADWAQRRHLNETIGTPRRRS